mgnify:CR=1 FL=1
MELKWVAVIAFAVFLVAVYVYSLGGEESEPGLHLESDLNDSSLGEKDISEEHCGEKGEPCCNGSCGEHLGCLNGSCVMRVLMFHNNAGPMCLRQLDFLDEMGAGESFVLEEHYTFEPGTRDLMDETKEKFDSSEGYSENFGYLPVTFVGGRAFSGFDENVEKELELLLG